MTSRKARELARKKVLELLGLAYSLAQNDLNLAVKYAEQAFDLSRKLRVKVPIAMKRKFCRRCRAPLIPGLTARFRVKRKTLVVSCLRCGWIRRYELGDKGKDKEEKSRARRR